MAALISLLGRMVQSSLDSIRSWAAKWRFKINNSNCVALRITKRTQPPPDSVIVDVSRLPWSHFLKNAIGCQANPAARRGQNGGRNSARNPLLPLLCRRSQLSIRMKPLIYFTFLPHMAH